MGMVLVYCFCCALLMAIVLREIKKRNQEKKRANLPPGSMGWPYIGETLQLYTQNPDIFFASRQKRLFHFSFVTSLSFDLILFFTSNFEDFDDNLLL